MTDTSDERRADIANAFYRNLAVGERVVDSTPSRADGRGIGRGGASGRGYERRTDRSSRLGVGW